MKPSSPKGRKLSHLVSEQNDPSRRRPPRASSSATLTIAVPSAEHKSLRHAKSLGTENFPAFQQGLVKLADVHEESDDENVEKFVFPARTSSPKPALRPLPRPLRSPRGSVGKSGRMSPIRRTSVCQNEDVLFNKRLRQDDFDHTGSSGSSSLRKANPACSEGAGCTSPIVDEFAPSAPPANSRLHTKVWSVAAVLNMRSRRVTDPQSAPKKSAWQSKITAITNMIRLSRKPTSEIQEIQSPDLAETSSAGRKGQRRKNSAMTLAPEERKSLHLVKAFGKNSRDLLALVARQDQGGAGKFPSMDALKVLLSSEKSTAELLDLAYDQRKLEHELKAGLQRHAKEEKKRRALEEADNRQRRGQVKKAPRRASMIQLETEEECRRKELGCFMPKDMFSKLLASQTPMAANQMVVARLMQSLVDLNRAGDVKRRWNVPMLRWYTCLDPDSWFINMWTIVYMALILHITTVGLFNIAFREGITAGSGAVERAATGDCTVSFSAEQWFDAGVDLFFIVDIFCRLLVFGQIVETKQEKGRQSKMEVVVDPEQVLRNYASKSLLVDLVTATPIQWISMALEAACLSDNAAALLLARCLRIFRITRVVKLFRTYKVRMWMRRLKRLTGSTSIMQMLHLVLGLAFLNHVWTCLSWLVQSIDDQGFEEFGEYMGLKATSSGWAQYSVMFMHTLQTIFAIQPYRGDTPLEAWFGSLTLALSVFISATMLSKILEIWQMANEAQTQRDSRINTVMQFTSTNGITTDLRNEVLDYFEFRYSNPAADFEKRFLDDLPTEMQARVISQMFPGALEKSALFQGTGEMFIAQLIVRIARRPMPTMPQQVILAQGAIGAEMFLLKSGTVEVATVDEMGQTIHVKTLGPGSTFGDLSMWMDSRHAATVTSLEFCQLHVLTRQDLEETLQAYPETVHVIASQALAHCIRSPVLAPALEGVPKSAAERMGRRMAHKRVELEPGEALYLEGEEADTAFIIRKGKVEVELLHGRLEGLDDVRCVGFEAMLSCNCYQDTVRAKETVVAYCISSQDIVDLFARDKDLLEQRELVAEQVYRQVGTKLVYLRWTLLSQDLLARTYEEQSNSARRFVGENLMETAFASNTGNPFGADAYTTEEESGKGELADRFVNMLRTSSGGTNLSPVSVLTEPRALDHSSLAPYARPAVSGQGRDSETSSDKSS